LYARAPRRPGEYLLALSAGRHRYLTPFTVRGHRSTGVLVVMPTITWQARNRIDSDGDGFPDVLPEASSAPVRRPFAGSGLPGGFSEAVASLLPFLDRERMRYEITTDAALALGGGASLDRYSGLLFAAPPRFVDRHVATRLTRFVRDGGRISWFGVNGLTAVVALDRHGLRLVGPQRRQNVLGERLGLDSGGGILVALGDRIEFFASSSFGPFPALEETVRLPSGARPLASAGVASERPALVVYRLGGGVVARLGVRGWTSPLSRPGPASGAVEQIMRRLWVLLSR
jgi:hypothetical protein